ncbi:MAG: amino acid racemase, partial [Oscillospiraceae bacterium]|nr:amino acid racemase [Oscillospiraceae bacterium]
GPAASCYFYDMLIRLCPVKQDQGHPDVLLYSKASIPDRSAYLLGRGESPLPALAEGIALLERMGATAIAVPCATAHHFYPEMQAAASVPVLNMLELTARALRKEGVTRAALLATEGSYVSGAFAAALEREGIAPLLPSREGRQALMDVIYGIKSGHMPGTQVLEALAAPLIARGAEKAVLGCTELSLFAQAGLPELYIDAMRVLAEELLQLTMNNEQ